jgi:hypothetical protein
MVEWSEGSGKPSPYGSGTCGGKLLRADDGTKAGKSSGPPAQGRPSCNVDQLGKTHVPRGQDGERGIEIGLVVQKAGRHGAPL